MRRNIAIESKANVGGDCPRQIDGMRIPRRQAILPPYIMRQLNAAESPGLRQAAARTTALDIGFRRQRQQPSSGARPEVQPGQAKLTIYDAEHGEILPGVAVRESAQESVSDPAVNEAWEGLNTTVRFLSEIFKRHSFDDDGTPLVASVHFGNQYMNAFWDGSQMVFGDGDGIIFRPFTGAIDVIGHELGHGVIADEGELAYVYEPGALNESLADVLGSMVKQFHLGQTARQADWLIGDQLLTSRVQGQGLRSLSMPGTAYYDPILGRDPQPAHMRDFVRTRDDNGGVHVNSGIPNRAFYLAATAIDGPSWECAGLIWYDALRNAAVSPATDFAQFARLTENAAARRFGNDSKQWAAVHDAWRGVGIEARPSERPLPWPLSRLGAPLGGAQFG